MAKSERFTIELLQRKGFVVEGHKAAKQNASIKQKEKVIKRKFGTLDDTKPNKVFINPLSVNSCWKGQRFKTDFYLDYEKDLLRLLQPIVLPEKPYKISFEFGLSSPNSDWDNPVKPLQDILQKKYGFNDKEIIEAYVRKVKVKKGQEYFEFKIETSFQKPGS